MKIKFNKERVWATTPGLLMIFFWTIITPSFLDPMYYVLVLATILFTLAYIFGERRITKQGGKEE